MGYGGGVGSREQVKKLSRKKLGGLWWWCWLKRTGEDL